MRDFLSNGRQKVEQGEISEGITQLVSVLAEAARLAAPAAEAEELRYAAETELSRIGAALEMESGGEWVDAGKNQVSASSLDVGTPKSLQPSVILTFNLGRRQDPRLRRPHHLPLRQGRRGAHRVRQHQRLRAGQLLPGAAGQQRRREHRARLAGLPGRRVRHSFTGLEKDFVYLPPARKATILVLERSADQVMPDPVILDTVFNRLKTVAFDFSHYNGQLLGDSFLKVFGGDPQEIRKLGLEKGVSYLVMVLNDGQAVNQLEMNGKKYNIFKSQTNATTRIIRISDGKVLYSGAVQGVDGQGGNREKAAIDGLRNAAKAMEDKLAGDLPRIMELLSGGVK